MRILHWFRKDLRLTDNTALHEASRDAAGDVVPFYASEPEILGRDDIAPIRVRFVLESLADLSSEIERGGSRLVLDHGPAVDTVRRAARESGADAVYWNDEYEPQLIARDAAVERVLTEHGIRVRRFHDRLLVPPGGVSTGEGRPYVVFGAFQRACARIPIADPLPAVTRFAGHELPARPIARLERLGFSTLATGWPGGARRATERLEAFVRESLAGYASNRDVPSIDGTSRLSADLKFGTLSPRQTVASVRSAAKGDRLDDDAARFVEELRWRDFFAHVLYHFPWCETGAFRREYDGIEWGGRPEHLDAWRAGTTGYPIVDAGMRQLAATGWMHNRVRMIVASFLTKDLLLDWRLGERHFMRHLIDGDLANNNGGWQWTASTGTDAQPYFRIFNPVRQGERFDPDGAYVRRWVPELERVPDRWIHSPWLAPESAVVANGVYPEPIVDHDAQRRKALAMYAEVR